MASKIDFFFHFSILICIRCKIFYKNFQDTICHVKFPVESKSELRIGVKIRETREIENKLKVKEFRVRDRYIDIFWQWGSIQRETLRRFYVPDIFWNFFLSWYNKNKIGRIREIVKKMIKIRFFEYWQGKIIVL